MRIVGFDPGGKNAFGWMVVEWGGRTPAAVGQGVCSNAAEAFDASLHHLPEPPAGIGIDAPLFWTNTGDRLADQHVRALVQQGGGHSATVSHVNSLRGACLVQGVLVAMLARAMWPEVALTEAHPKALLRVCAAARQFVEHELLGGPLDEHVRDAALAAFSAHALLHDSPGWIDLAAAEPDAVFPLDHETRYWFPARLL